MCLTAGSLQSQTSLVESGQILDGSNVTTNIVGDEVSYTHAVGCAVMFEVGVRSLFCRVSMVHD